MTGQIRLSAKFENGKIWWRNSRDDNAIWFYRTRQEAEDIAQGFRESAKIYKWWAPEALEYARQMEEAIEQYDAALTCCDSAGRCTFACEYDAQENEDEELRYITETANAG